MTMKDKSKSIHQMYWNAIFDDIITRLEHVDVTEKNLG